MAMSPAACLAPLFVPADRPERFAKAAASGADAIILDLEDAVAPGNKGAALSALRTDFTELPIIVRINAAGTQWHEADLATVAALPIAAIMLPMAERPEEVLRVAQYRPVIALVESVAGIAAARDIARCGAVARMAFGSVDYAADLGCDHVRDALANARAELVFASRLGNLPAPLDGVTTDVSDGPATEDDARHAAAIGFGGKLAIHPRQIAAIRDAFTPSSESVDWALRVLGSGDGVAVVDGKMVDEPVRIRARKILARR